MTRNSKQAESIRAQLLKVLRLAREGVGGEKENAQTLLSKLLKKHGLTMADLEDTDADYSPVWLRHKNAMEETLLKQIIKKFCGRERKLFGDRRKRRTIVVETTAPEAAAITVAYDVYREAWHRQLDDLMIAFCWKHQLYAPDTAEGDDDEEVELSPEDRESAKRAAHLVAGMQHVEAPQRRIASGRA